jgi:hypothetical protein
VSSPAAERLLQGTLARMKSADERRVEEKAEHARTVQALKKTAADLVQVEEALAAERGKSARLEAELATLRTSIDRLRLDGVAGAAAAEARVVSEIAARQSLRAELEQAAKTFAAVEEGYKTQIAVLEQRIALEVPAHEETIAALNHRLHVESKRRKELEEALAKRPAPAAEAPAAPVSAAKALAAYDLAITRRDELGQILAMHIAPRSA